MLDAKEIDDDGLGAAAVYLAWESEEDGTRIRHEHSGGEHTDLHLPNPRRHGALIIRDAADQWVNDEGTLTLDETAHPGVIANVLVDAVGQPTACVQADPAQLTFCWGPGGDNVFVAPVYSQDGTTQRLGIGVETCNEYCPETDNEAILERFRRWSGTDGNPSSPAGESGIPDTLKELLKGSGASDGYRPGSTILPGVLKPVPKPEHIGPDFTGVRQPGSTGAKPGPTVSSGSGAAGGDTGGDPFGSGVKDGRDTSAPSSPWPGSGTDWVNPDPFGWLHRPYNPYGPEYPFGNPFLHEEWINRWRVLEWWEWPGHLPPIGSDYRPPVLPYGPGSFYRPFPSLPVVGTVLDAIRISEYLKWVEIWGGDFDEEDGTVRGRIGIGVVPRCFMWIWVWAGRVAS